MKVQATPRFIRDIKKLHPSEKSALDEAVNALLEAPLSGEAKKGDLASLRVYKYKHNNQQQLLAYQIQAGALVLAATVVMKIFIAI